MVLIRKASECLERIVQSYIEQVYAKKHNFDSYTVETLQDDEESLKTFFTKYARKGTITASLKLLQDLRELLEA